MQKYPKIHWILKCLAHDAETNLKFAFGIFFYLFIYFHNTDHSDLFVLP